MILLGSFLHRQELSDIIGRAVEDRVSEDDPRRLKLIVNLNSYLMRIWATSFAERLFSAVRGHEVRGTPARTKGELKDLIVSSPWYPTPRIEELAGRYRRFPQDYYRETPYEGVAFTTGDPPRYVGSRRIKRIRRIAEKCGRRLIDYMFDQIRQRADELASDRARRLGIPKDRLITPPEEMVEEFRHAERRVLKSIREGMLVAAMPQFYIDDVVGLRVLVDPHVLPVVESWLAGCDDLSVVDEKRFSGRFTGRNMVVAYRLPREELLAQMPADAACNVLIGRGVAADRPALMDAYREFVGGGEGHVRFEILLIDYESLVESEIGLSMHEQHVLEQREMQEYRGRLAQNVEALMIFLFAYALSARTRIGPMPIKLGGSYLPDYLDSVLRSLYPTGPGSLGLTM
ncbi:MAG: hypothetical protein FJ087_22515 [Deltaproteobacteria bacterium]|nr:hypothetical protein [Deltaproteobacteria bacterium]